MYLLRYWEVKSALLSGGIGNVVFSQAFIVFDKLYSVMAYELLLCILIRSDDQAVNVNSKVISSIIQISGKLLLFLALDLPFYFEFRIYQYAKDRLKMIWTSTNTFKEKFKRYFYSS